MARRMTSLALGTLTWIARQRRLNARVPQILRYGGWLAVAPVRLVGINSMLLTTIGRKTKTPRTMPLAYLKGNEDLVVLAPYAPSGKHPHWYLNLKSDPRAIVEIMWRKRAVTAEEIVDEAEKAKFQRLYVLGLLGGLSEESLAQMPVIRLKPS